MGLGGPRALVGVDIHVKGPRSGHESEGETGEAGVRCWKVTLANVKVSLLSSRNQGEIEGSSVVDCLTDQTSRTSSTITMF